MAFIPFPQPLVEATFLARRKRFLADMELSDGSRLVAHCANTGSMRDCLEPGARALIWDSQNPKRKLPWSWKAILIGGETWVGIDTGLPNRLVEAALRAGEVPALRGYDEVLRERRMGARSRVDLQLRRGEGGPEELCWVEVKNVTQVSSEGLASFPDAVTTRGLKHLQELSLRVAEGSRAAMVYLIQRADGLRFTSADSIDPAYGEGLRRALAAGVEVYALGAEVSPEGVGTRGLLPISL